MSRPEEKKHIVIVGGGFAGVRAALDLDRRLSGQYRIILVDRNSYHSPYAMLYEAAAAFITGNTKSDFNAIRAAIAIPYHLIIRGTNISFVKGSFEEIDYVGKRVKVDGYRIPYDYAVISIGSTTNYFGIEGLEDISYPLKNLDDAQNLRNAIEELFARKPHHEPIDIVIGGAGLTGVEIGAELPALLKSLRTKYKRSRKSVSLTLVEAGEVVLPGAHPTVSRWTRDRLQKLGVHLLMGSALRSCEDNRVHLASGVSVPCDILIWTAGITTHSVMDVVADTPREKKYFVTDKYLRIEKHPEVYLAGDLVHSVDQKTGKPIAATAQRALAHGECIAENVYRSVQNLPLLEYEPEQSAYVIPLGAKYAVADLWGYVRFKGFLPWMLKLFIEYNYLVSIISFPEATKKWLYGLSVYVRND